MQVKPLCSRLQFSEFTCVFNGFSMSMRICRFKGVKNLYKLFEVIFRQNEAIKSRNETKRSTNTEEQKSESLRDAHSPSYAARNVQTVPEHYAHSARN